MGRFRLGLWSMLVLAAGSAAAAERRPNFLFVFSDDQRFDAMSCVQKEMGEKGRYPWLRTPVMDRIAAQGVRFRNAFVVNSLCSPSRACYLTGRYNHANGVINNRTPFPVQSVTHASLLRAAGYSTGYVGKWHMGNQPERPGFDWYASFTGQGRYEDPTFLVNGQSQLVRGWMDDISTDFAIRFLEKERAAEKPFLLVVGFKSTHGPFEPPPRLKDRYAGAKARVVPNLGRNPGFNPDQAQPMNPPTTPEVPANLDYFRCVNAIDDNLGKLLDALDRLKLSENTVVIFASDNGFYMGEHGLGDKRSGYEESMRIPLLLRDPRSGARGVVRDDLVLNIDLAPTLLDLAGLPVPPEMHGKSWKPLLAAQPPSSPFRASFLYEYFQENGGNSAAPRGPGGYNTPTMTAVRTPTHKLLRYLGHPEWTELFDLSADPYELTNLASKPEHTELRQHLEGEHDRLTRELGYHVPGHVDRPLPRAKAVSEGWVLDYTFQNDDGKDVRDDSNQGALGTARNAPRGNGDMGRKVRRFAGDGSIDVNLTPGLDCAETPFVVEATFRAEKPDGILVARGGASHGYALALRGGVPQFTLNVNGQSTVLKAAEPVGTQRVTVRVEVLPKRMVLFVDGKDVARIPIERLIARNPNEGMQIGTDAGSPVNASFQPGFQGDLERVRIYRGLLPAPKP